MRRPAVRGSACVVVASTRVKGQGPRAVVVGTGDRVDVAVGGEASPLPGGMSSQATDGLLTRHIAILVVPLPNGTLLRALSLHPDCGFAVVPLEGSIPTVDVVERMPTPTGSVVGWNALRLIFGGLVLDVVVDGSGASDVLELLPAGTQLAFHEGAAIKVVATAVSSIAGPALDGAGGGGHAIPALVQMRGADGADDGSLVLRARDGVVRVDVPVRDLMRGILIGRSRRCTLGRGFNENEGLSRIHALVVALDEPGAVGVFAFDLASRYGLRDVSRPSRMVPTARLDDGVGCLVYGAGYLTWEPS